MSNNMKDKLDKFKSKNVSPTAAIMEPIKNSEKEIEIDKSEDSKNDTSKDRFESLNVKKDKVENTHSRKTFLVRNDLIKRINKAAKERHHGFQTEFINIAIEYALDQIEDN